MGPARSQLLQRQEMTHVRHRGPAYLHLVGQEVEDLAQDPFQGFTADQVYAAHRAMPSVVRPDLGQAGSIFNRPQLSKVLTRWRDLCSTLDCVAALQWADRFSMAIGPRMQAAALRGTVAFGDGYAQRELQKKGPGEV